MVMPKVSEEQIHVDEKKIIDQLRENSNRSINEIADKLGLGYYVLLLKKNVKPMKMEALENITSREIEQYIKKMGCEMISSLYTNGFYDWVIVFTAPDTVQAKRVNELFINRYHEFLTDVKLLETIFPAKVKGKVNPNVKKLTDFF